MQTRTFLSSPERGQCREEVELVPNYSALRKGDKRNTHTVLQVRTRLT